MRQVWQSAITSSHRCSLHLAIARLVYSLGSFGSAIILDIACVSCGFALRPQEEDYLRLGIETVCAGILTLEKQLVALFFEVQGVLYRHILSMCLQSPRQCERRSCEDSGTRPDSAGFDVLLYLGMLDFLGAII